MDEKDREIQKAREYNYVLWTIIVVLAIMLVNLFAQQTCNNETFVNQVSFASTISSIILSVIAIIMTVVSSDSINNLLHKFRDLCDVLQDAPKKIESSTESIRVSSEKLKEVEENIKGLPQILNDNQNALNSILSSIKDAIGQLDGKILDIQSETTTMRRELSDVGNKMAKNLQNKTLQGKIITEDTLKDIILNNMSYFHTCLLYAIKITFENNKKLSIPKLSFTISPKEDAKDYFFSFMQSLIYFGLISADDSDLDNIIFSKVDKVIIDEIENAFDVFLSSRSSKLITKDRIDRDKDNIKQMILEETE